ncbi:hypothetical protein [Jiulongibacter sediminis]|uniref:Lipoprotein n=1 Tax=Jiulongibacter sediminis TaxID=1605367 RepID=A0A0P7BVX0_9BACT|nr:hypothetical protein [Jiulongibacter sediminis]KPM48792.1 hypothetical protein AFM12_09455 [Jiulongibacter sediminis]TBX25324.1 hypothetical protein TK44_09460 [Jiulongibacter sediminis]
MISRLFAFLLLFFIFSCGQKDQVTKNVTGAIYHWKSIYNPEAKDLKKLDDLQICKQYIRFFDIDRKGTEPASPKSVIRFRTLPLAEVIPVVYITNRTFQGLSETEIDTLATRTLTKIRSIADENEISFNSIQLDCDWSKSTQKAYFRLLRKIEEQLDNATELTSTLRLHQVKFMEQTGIPPASRVSLMLYNVGDWTNPLTPNSLFDPKIIDQYIYRIPEYPLPIDIALPIYQQTLVYRNNKLFTFMKSQSYEDVSKALRLKKIETSRNYVCLENGEFLNKSFRKGDIFRFESVDYEQLKLVNKAVKSRIQNQNTDLIFYHLDQNAVSQFSKKEFRRLLQ